LLPIRQTVDRRPNTARRRLRRSRPPRASPPRRVLPCSAMPRPGWRRKRGRAPFP